MKTLCTAILAALLAPTAAADTGKNSGLSYQRPADAIARIVEHPLTPMVGVSPDNRRLLIMEWPDIVAIDQLAQPELRLAGRRINPRTNGRSRQRYSTGLRILTIADQSEHTVGPLPKSPIIDHEDWSPDSKWVAFTVTDNRGIALYIADAATGKTRRLTAPALNATAGAPCQWMPNSKGLLCKTVMPNRGRPPPKSPVPTGPLVRESSGKKAAAPTFQDLLQNPHDEALFDYYFTSCLERVSLDGRRVQTGIRGIIVTAEPSPDGEFILVEKVRRPYSYLVRYNRFPLRVEVFRPNGKRVARMADLPLAESIPIAIGSVRTGRRSFGWRADAPATLYWAEAQDGGDSKRKAAVRDRIYMQRAPFRKPPVVLIDLALRFSSIYWGTDDLALVSDWQWSDRRTRTLLVAPSKPGKKGKVLFDRSWEDRYSDPGSPVLRPTARGTRVLQTADDGRSLFLIGRGASEQGNRPFVDKLDTRKGKSTRLWRSQAPYYEYPMRILDSAGKRILTRRESKTEPPNFFLRDLAAGSIAALTKFAHPHPELDGVQKKLIRYKRNDGVALTAMLYLPPGYRKGTRLPMVMWAYPTEFKSAAAAGQVTDSPHRFSRVGWWSPLMWLLRGYAVLDHPTMPIVGEGRAEPNDTYVRQLVASAQAAVDEVARRGVADRDRIAIGGHSYGAFMTANLLAHSDLFRAGIARSGAYNRTLTPFGFQAEERTLWEAPEVYFRMSPFMHASSIDEPLLLIHGAADNNTGTYPVQSRRMYQALKGLGGIVRLVMLPHESHGYRARESILHMLWETDRWLTRHVAEAGPRPKKPKGKKRSKGKKSRKRR